jgi:hypothetical protein
MAVLLGAAVVPGGAVGRLSGVLRDNTMTAAELERMERGYYESILDADRGLDGLSHPGTAHHEVVPFDAGPLTDMVPDVREFVLKPNFSADLRGARWTTNSLRMRDQPYSRTKPTGTFRIAFLGDSIGAGWGVDDGQGFEPALERSLDARSRAADGPRVEILNFAVPGHAPGQRWEDFVSADGWALGTDLVLYEATPAEVGWDERRLRGLLARGVGADASVYREPLESAGIRPHEDVELYKHKLRPLRRELLAGVYRTIANECRARGVPSIWVLVPRVGKPADAAETARLMTMARDAGFSAVLDVSDAYDGREPSRLAIGRSDFHPNTLGHALLANRLEAVLRGVPAVARLGMDVSAHGGERR